jgi:superfamily II DNA or RNA helicase
VWADPHRIGEHQVRQLLVPEHDGIEIDRTETGEIARSARGAWAVARDSQEVTTGAERPLNATLPLEGTTGRLGWIGSMAQTSAASVLESYRDAVSFQVPGGNAGLRRPQLAALHSIVGYQASGVDEPAIVVMPTGTGKTETMVAWMVAQAPEKLLVVVPSVVLRDQIAEKFETLGVLQQVGAVASSALRPRVLRLDHRIADQDQVAELVDAANVIVTLPHTLRASEPEVRATLLAACSHLVVDEAHHAPAAMWSDILRGFSGRPVLLFTATPFRSDGRPIPGRTIFRFPLREAQRDGYFSRIELTAVVGMGDADEELARAAIARLRADINAGFDHVMLARAADRVKAEWIHSIYRRLAPELEPRIVHQGLSKKEVTANLADLRLGACRVVVCVDMLGEGFDMQTLKVAAFHDTRKSLSPMIQLIGRVARTSATLNLGTASVFIKREPRLALSPMRHLLREDVDWNVVLSDVSDRETARAEELSDFDASFAEAPTDVPVGLLEPKMSAVAFPTDVHDWSPEAALEVYAERVLDGVVSVTRDGDLAWFVIEEPLALRWGQIPALRVNGYDLVVMYLDRRHGLLFVYGSDTKKDYTPLARAVLGHQVAILNGPDTFRVFGGVDRVIPTNVGLLDSRDRDARFSLFVGSDVQAAIRPAERRHKSNTHIAAKGMDSGESVTIAAAMSGRFWSMQTANGLLEWRKWCYRQGERLVNRSIDLTAVFRDMIIPTDIVERPPYALLAAEWPWKLYTGSGTTLHVRRDGASYLITDTGFRVDDHESTGPFRLTVVTPTWEVAYVGTVDRDGVHWAAVDEDAELLSRTTHAMPLAEWLNANKPTLFLAGDRVITEDDRLLDAAPNLQAFDARRLETLPWEGVDIRVESQGERRRQDSVQAYVARRLTAEEQFDVLIDDDRSGEAADLVGLRIDGNELVITLVHCKYSSGASPGARVADLYEVCGQAMRGARWRDGGGLPLFNHLERRIRAFYGRTGRHPFEVGDIDELYRVATLAPQLYPRFVTIIAQPGLSAARSSREQLQLLAGAESYVQTITKGTMRVLVSA